MKTLQLDITRPNEVGFKTERMGQEVIPVPRASTFLAETLLSRIKWSHAYGSKSKLSMVSYKNLSI